MLRIAAHGIGHATDGAPALSTCCPSVMMDRKVANDPEKPCVMPVRFALIERLIPSTAPSPGGASKTVPPDKYAAVFILRNVGPGVKSRGGLVWQSLQPA